jgi:hypothetical protein
VALVEAHAPSARITALDAMSAQMRGKDRVMTVSSFLWEKQSMRALCAMAVTSVPARPPEGQ